MCREGGGMQIVADVWRKWEWVVDVQMGEDGDCGGWWVPARNFCARIFVSRLITRRQIIPVTGQQSW